MVSRTPRVVVVLLMLWIEGRLGPGLQADEPIRFSRDILPILSDNCFHCHGPDSKSREGELRLDTEEGAKRVDSPVIVAGKHAQSELFRRITSSDPETVMPPPKTNRKLTAAQIDLLKKWIDDGAPWGKHWAFEPVQRPAVPMLPATSAGSSKLNPIDAFIRDRLAKEKLSPAPEAAKETLIRRVTMDLTGLPPTPEEVAAFVADASPDAYEKVVDRLFASSRFGERMVWEWLDAARYADTNGYQGDPTRTMFFWRDWAIRALNNNMPFDQFTIEQLAGDLLPNPSQDQLIATGFHRNHMINGEGGRIAEESRVDYVQDRVETTGTVWLGLTLNCCRCHNHKYDALTQREYYQLAAYFNSIDESGGNDARGLANPIISLTTPEQQVKITEAKEKEQAANRVRDDRQKQLTAEFAAWEKERLAELLPAAPPANDGNAKSNADVDSLLEKKPPKKSSERKPLPDDIVAILKKPGEQRSDAEKKKLTDFHLNADAQFPKLVKAADDAKKGREAAENSQSRTMVMRERPQPRETFVLVRGAYDKFGEKVSHGVPASLPSLDDRSPNNRLALANWLMRTDHPLTARVTVNRLWQTLFGVGLVKTAEDFGVQGEKPSHPELLDWLAAEFQQPTVPQPTVVNSHPNNAWNVKHIQRLIVTSATYRQSSSLRLPGGAALLERDPENRLLARGARYRWPSWMLRDQALAASGLLVEKLGGPPVKGYQPPGIWEEATFGKIQYQQDKGEALHRRSLYQFWRRIVGPTTFFDVATRQTCQVKVARTNTALHALVTLNDVTYVEAARALAQRVLKETATPSSEQRLEKMFRLVLARRPSPAEQTVLLKAAGRLADQYRAAPDAALKLIRAGESPRDESLDAIDHATWSALASAVLNLDETLNKE